MGYEYEYGWAPYVSVAERRRKAMKKMQALRKKGVDIQPVSIEGRSIAKTFWGKAWCNHLESFSDFENRLPRGRTYVRNGSVCHLAIAKGSIEAKVSGSELYTIKVTIKTLASEKWASLKQRCSGKVGSLLELLQGRLSDHVMELVTDRNEGLFPLPGEMSFDCSCPDWASMCKHVAAALYGIGARLDTKPELLFLLRGVDHEELIQADAETAVATATSRGKSKRLAAVEIGDVFGIELEPVASATSGKDAVADASKGRSVSAKCSAKKRSVKKKVGKTSAKKQPEAKPEAKRPAAKKATLKTADAKRSAVKKAVRKKAALKKPVKKPAAKKLKTQAA